MSDKFIAKNPRARYDYFIEETFEAGLMLVGTEVKTLRAGRVTLTEAYAGESDGELRLLNLHIPVYEKAGAYFQHEVKRSRKLLLHKKEMNKILGALRRDGMTLVPLSLYFNRRGLVKIKLGLAKGKKTIDKREVEKKRDWQRQKERLMRDKG